MIPILITLFLLMKAACCAHYQYQLSVCAIFQDEEPFLKEWIEFHRLVGVEHFYLYNHRSNDNYLEILNPYIKMGIVELVDKPKVARRIKVFNRLQCGCYNECLDKANGKSKWVAFIDIDEYLFPVQDQSLVEVLSRYENQGGVCVNWRMFGTSDIDKLSKEKPMIEQLTRCSPKSFTLNRYIKSIVRPERASHFSNPHHPAYLEEYKQVNTDHFPFEEQIFSSYIQTNTLRINHYWTRDEDFFYHKKVPRQKRWGGSPQPKEILQKLNEEQDLEILRFSPNLVKRIN